MPPELPAEAPAAVFGGKSMLAAMPPAALSGKVVPAAVPVGSEVHEGQLPATSLSQSQSINSRPVDQAKLPGELCQGFIVSYAPLRRWKNATGFRCMLAAPT